MSEDNTRPAWREPMVWLVALIPALAVVATTALVVVAGGAGATDTVAEPVRRTAQVQVADLGPDARAQRLRLSAIVRTDGRMIEVLPVSGAFGPGSLRIALHHPALADLDRSFLLKADANGWRAAADFDPGHDWNVQLEPVGGAWRLQGRWPAKQHAAYLRPALTEAR